MTALSTAIRILNAIATNFFKRLIEDGRRSISFNNVERKKSLEKKRKEMSQYSKSPSEIENIRHWIQISIVSKWTDKRQKSIKDPRNLSIQKVSFSTGTAWNFLFPCRRNSNDEDVLLPTPFLNCIRITTDFTCLVS